MTREQTRALLDEAEQIRRSGFNAQNQPRFDELMSQVERDNEVRTIVSLARLGDGFADRLLDDRDITVETVRTRVFEELASRSDAAPPLSGRLRVDDLAARGGGGGADLLARMAEGLAARYDGPKAGPEAQEFVHLTPVDMARYFLEQRGVHTRLMSRNQIIQRALHTTSDFAALLEGTGNRFLRDGYGSYQGGVIRICRQSTAPDFRAKQKLQLGEAPQLVKVGQHGEVTRGTMAEGKSSYSLETFARIFGITRQALVNDDLGAFAQLATKLGRSAAEFVAAQLAAKLASNPVLDDSIALFDAAHGNVGTTGVIQISSLGEGLKLMRLQKGLDGKTPIDVTPKYLVVPAALEVVARQHVALVNAAKSSDVNPFSADLEVVVDPRLDAVSATAWYLAADPNTIDTIEYSYLEGEAGPQIETRSGFDVEGVEMKVRLDFGCGVIDFRGLFKNAGQ